MRGFFVFLIKQKIKTVILVCIFVIPYIYWVICFIDSKNLKLASWIVSKINQNKREIKILARKIKHRLWIVYKKIYLALFMPFVVLCITLDDFNNYVSENSAAFVLVSAPCILFILLILRRFFENLIESFTRRMNFFDETMKRPARNVLVYVMSLFLMPILGLGFIFFMALLPVIIAWGYVEWVRQCIRLIRKRKEVKKGKQRKPLVLYKYRTLKNWNSHRDEYLAGKLFFADRRTLNDPAESISLLNRTAINLS